MLSISGPTWLIQDLEAVIFDKDGTIADLHLFWSEIVRRRAHAVVAEFGLAEDLHPNIGAAMGLSPSGTRLMPQGPVGLASRDEIILILCKHLESCGVKTSAKKIAELFDHVHEAFLPEIDKYLQPIPGVAELIASLHQGGARLAVVTSDTEINTRHTLEKLGLSTYFNAVVGRDTTPEAKISGVPALKALKMLGRCPGKAACIGDAPMDLFMAKASGCHAGIAVATGQTPIDELRQHTDYVALAMTDLKTSIGSGLGR